MAPVQVAFEPHVRARMKTHADVQPAPWVAATLYSERALDRDRTAHAVLGPRKGEHEPVAGRPDLHATTAAHVPAHHRVVLLQEREPVLVAETLEEQRGAFDVGEQDRGDGSGHRRRPSCAPER
jgi:hypothetical protein